LHRKLDTKRTSCKSLLVNDRNVKFYTGLPSKAVFDLLYKYVHDKVQQMHYWRRSTTTKILPDGTPVKKRGRVRKLDQRDELLLTLTPLPGNKIFEIFSHMCNICNTYPEKAVTALGRVISGYTAT